MARRKELFSEHVAAGSRTYFFDVKQSEDKAMYLLISESRRTSGKSYSHKRVMVFEENIMAFEEGLKKTVRFVRKTLRQNMNKSV